MFIQNVNNFKEMVKSLNEIVYENCFTAKALLNDVVKINVNTPDNFRKLVSGLRATSRVFYTYQLKSERIYKIVIRNLYYPVVINDIMEA